MDEPSVPTTELAQLLDQTDAPIGRSLLLLSEALQQTTGITSDGLKNLDELSEDVASSAAGPPELTDLIDTIFVKNGFSGDVENYHGEDNSFLDRVLDRRMGMPITLSAIVATVGERVGLQLKLIGLPGHVVVGSDDGQGHFTSFIDAFSGTQLDRSGLAQRLTSIFGREIEITDAMLVPMSTMSVVSRVSNNLMHTWSHEPAKLDHLLEVRSHIPQPETDRRTLAEIAEARSRFDIAARVRQSINPDDPAIKQLWAKLN